MFHFFFNIKSIANVTSSSSVRNRKVDHNSLKIDFYESLKYVLINPLKSELSTQHKKAMHTTVTTMQTTRLLLHYSHE